MPCPQFSPIIKPNVDEPYNYRYPKVIYANICNWIIDIYDWIMDMSNSHYNRLTHVSKLTILDQVESFPICSLCTW